MATRVEWHFNDVELERLLRDRNGPVGRMVRRVADRTASLARSYAPVDSGRLRASIRVKFRAGEREVKAWVYTNLDHGLYVHEGTGIYGPRGRPIRPRRGRFLVFPGEDGRLVFAREVRGQRPQRFLLRALENASPWPVDDTVIYT